MKNAMIIYIVSSKNVFVAARQRTHLKNHLIKKLCLMSSKCLALDAGHM
jgi:hypothetical protein